MENTALPKTIRRLLTAAVVLFAGSLALLGTNIYLTLAAPPQSVFSPTTVSFEGYLANADGSPFSGSNPTLAFHLYDAQSGGTSLWDETHSNVSVSQGLYTVQLGSAGSPLNADLFNGARWLSVAVNGGAEMSPRIAISAVPWALNAVEAQQALNLQGFDVADTAPQNGNALVWNSTSSKWEPQGVSGDATSLQGRPVDAATPTAGQALTWDGSSWVPATTSGNATSLQGNPISTAVPQDNSALLWNQSLNQWVPGTVATPIPQTVPSVRAYNSVGVTANNNANVTLPFDTETWDVGNLHDTAPVNNTKFIIQTPGRYLVIGRISYSQGQGSGSRIAKINVTSAGVTTLMASVSYVSDTNILVSTIVYLNTNDFVQLQAKQTSGFSLTAAGQIEIIWLSN